MSVKVELAYSIRWHKHYREYRERGMAMESIINDAVKHMHKYLSFKPHLKVKIVPLRNDSVRGQCHLDANQIDINVRTNPSIFVLVETLCHEFVHAKQAYLEGFKSIPGAYVWQSKIYKANKDFGDEYFNYPWEIEAHAKQGPIAKLILKDMGIQNPHIPVKFYKEK